MPIYKRGETWHIQFNIGGRRFRSTAGRGATQAQAKELEAKLRVKAQEEIYAGRIGKTLDRTFGEALAKWMQSGAPDSMIDHITAVRNRLEHVKLSKIIVEVNLFKEEMLKAKKAPATVNRRLAVVRRILNLCYDRWDWIAEPLGRKIEMLREKNERHVYLSPEQVEELANACTHPEAARMVRLAAYTGLRRGELLGLQSENIVNGRIILNAKTKSGKPRVIPVLKELHDLLEDLPIQLTKNQLKHYFNRAAGLLGYTDLHFHDLRHSFASWLVSNPNVPLTSVRDLLGHSSLAVTSRYSHLSTKILDDAISNLTAPKKKLADENHKKATNDKNPQNKNEE